MPLATHPLRPRIVGGLALAATIAVLSVACGSRGPLDDEPLLDAAAADVASADISVPEPLDASPPQVDGGRESGTLLECGACLVNECTPEIFACVQSPACVQAFQCVITDCLGGAGGGFDPICMFKCASGDPQGTVQLLGIFQCVTGDCGPDCRTVLGGLLGGLGGGGGGGGGGKKSEQKRAFARAFSAWPELSTPLLRETADER